MRHGAHHLALTAHVPDFDIGRPRGNLTYDFRGDELCRIAQRRVNDLYAQAALRFPINPPQTKEAYWYRELFEREFPGEACARTVPGGKSIACSSPAAIEWDAAFSAAADPSGRAVAGVHVAAA